MIGSLAYDRAGEGPPLVLVHPLGADRHVWAPVTQRLAAHRDVIAVDLPGFGDSPALPDDGEGPPTPARLAAAVRAFVADELGIERFHVAGNSLGGWVALVLALDGGALSVSAIAPAGLWPRPLGPKPSVARRLARATAPIAGVLGRSRALRRVVLAGLVAHPENVPADAVTALVRAYAGAPDFVAVNAAMRGGRFDDLARITVPVTLIWPDRDRLIARPRDVPAGVREVVLTSAGHLPMWDAPDAIAQALLEGSVAHVAPTPPLAGA